MLFSRPNTKQSWVGGGSLGGARSASSQPSPALGSTAGRAPVSVGIYGSIDGAKENDNGKKQGGGNGGGRGELPNMYSVLATDSIPMLTANGGAAAFGGEFAGFERNPRAKKG